MWIRASDTVIVIAGADRGTRGKVLRVDHEAGKVVVEGVNRVYKHVRKSQKNPQGGRLSREMPIALSNVALICGACGAAARMGARYQDDGAKQRYCKKCGAANGQIAPAKAQYAKK
jgi:large subunit ribosomal protein L24